MSETNNESSLDFKKFSEDFSKKLDGITSGLTLLGDNVEKKTDALNTKIESIKTKESDDNSSGISDYDKEETEKIERIANKIAESKLGQVKQELNAEKQYEKDCAEWDSKASKDFPHIQIPAIKREVEIELAKMPVIKKSSKGENMYAADAVYNAASRVIARKVATGELSKLPDPEPLDYGDFSPKIKGKEVSQVQMELAARLGISPERAKIIYKDYQPRKRN